MNTSTLALLAVALLELVFWHWQWNWIVGGIGVGSVIGSSVVIQGSNSSDLWLSPSKMDWQVTNFKPGWAATERDV